jgi:hypothetical protein
MVNSLTNNRPKKTKDGTCPYCGEFVGKNHENIKPSRNGREVRKHSSCGLYFVVDPNKNIIYPIQNPSDEDSTPYL